MSGFHLDPDGDVYAQARGKIEGLVTHLAHLKNIPVTTEYLSGVARFIVEYMELGDLYKAVHMPDQAVLHQLVWRANNELDWRAAVIAVRIFAHAAEFVLPTPDLCEVASHMIDRMKGTNPVSPATYQWPPIEEIEAIARREIAKNRPTSVAALEAAILPVVLPRPTNLDELPILAPGDEAPGPGSAVPLSASGTSNSEGDPGADTFGRAEDLIWTNVIHLRNRKNVPASDPECIEIGSVIARNLDPRDLYKLLYTQDAGVTDEVIWRANNCLDYIAASSFVRVYERASQLGPLSDDAFGRLIDGLIARLKGSNPVGPQTYLWPVPQAIEAMATAAIAEARPSNPEELQAAILPAIMPRFQTDPGAAVGASPDHRASEATERQTAEPILTDP